MLGGYYRYQIGLTLEDVYPSLYPFCSCGCGNILTGRKKRWASTSCQSFALTQFLIVKGDTSTIRAVLFDRDHGICSLCKRVADKWHADHINPVHKGGGATSLENFQTLCVPCHQNKSGHEISQMASQRAAISSQTAST